jgi:hypothetical protein
MFASAVLLAGFLMASTLERGARAVHSEHVAAVGEGDSPEVPPAA